MKKYLRNLACAVAGVLVAMIPTQAVQAAPLPGPAFHPVEQTVIGSDDGVIKVAHKTRAKRAKRRFTRKSYRRHHRRFHKRYHPRRPHYRKAHRRFHRHYRRKHKGPRIYIGVYPNYYDPFYYSPRYYDPYYYEPRYRHRMSCNRAKRIVRRHGYRRVRAYDAAARCMASVPSTKDVDTRSG